MASRTEPFVPGEWYHCYSRGVEKRTIFTNQGDYVRFQLSLLAANSVKSLRISDQSKLSKSSTIELLLEKRNGGKLVEVGAYALMPNHYHLLLKEIIPGGISSFMRKVDTGYTMYFNIKYQRTGVLFGSSFKSRVVSADAHLRRVINYIHGNPAVLKEPHIQSGVIRNRVALERFLLEYRFSSLVDYAADRLESAIVSRDALRNTTDVDLSVDRVVSDLLDFLRSDLGKEI